MLRKITKSALLLTACAAVLSSCNRETDLYNPYASAQDYANNWEGKFGDIDPNQNWNTAVSQTVTVVINGTATVSIYSKTSDSRLLAQDVVSGTKALKFDATADLKEVYVIASADNSRQVLTVELSENAVADFTQASQAKARKASSQLTAREHVYALNYNLFPGDKSNAFGSDLFGHLNQVGNDHNFYKSWNSEVYTTVRFDNQQPVGTDTDMSSLQDVVEGCSNIYIETDDDITKLYPFTKDLKIVTSKAEPITLTGIYRNTAGYTSLAYFYAPEGASIEELKAADKYILIPNTNEIVGKTYNLVYYDPANNYAPSYTFPTGVEVHFALVCNPSCNYTWVDWTQETGDVMKNVMNGTLWEFSNAEMNKDVYTQYKGWTNMSGAALYSYHGVNILSFEDWGGQFTEVNGVPTPEGLNSVDWNDIAFAVNMEMQTPPPPVEPEEAMAWIIACEDLGSTDDYDFNDIVFSISHVGGSPRATVTPLAAGGTLPAYLYYDAKQVGEIHSLLKPGASTSEMINTIRRGTPGASFTIDVPTDYSVTNNMGGFSIMVQGNNAITLTAPALGTAPQMLCLPETWLWPLERERIEKAYPLFVNWNQNAGQNVNWYNTFNADKLVK